jgi:DNA-binding response OmpR family regulator
MSANNRSIRILVVGREPALLETYAILFTRAGYQTQTAGLGESAQLLETVKHGVLVLDHTLSKEQRHWLVHLARKASLNTRVMALHSNARDCGADLAMDSREGPDAIVAGVRALMARRRPRWVWMESVKSLLRFGTSAKAS